MECNKDYEVRPVCTKTGDIGCYNDSCDDCRWTAFPITQPVEGDDELWHKAINLIMAAHDKGLSKEDAVGIIKSQFTIKKK